MILEIGDLKYEKLHLKSTWDVRFDPVESYPSPDKLPQSFRFAQERDRAPPTAEVN